jgi:hypothetical protein
MPSKKSKKDKKRKARLSDKDIIKLLKKLRPKNQQIVRVNIGDKDGQKKSTAFQPNIVPVISYAAPFQSQPTPPPLPPPLPVSQQPQLQPLILPRNVPPRLPNVLESESEFESPVKPRKQRQPRRTREQIRADQEQEQLAAIEEQQRSRFTAPKLFKDGGLSDYAYQRSHFQPPTNNDRFWGQAIDEDPMNDQAGVVAQPVSSDEWTGTPQGDFEQLPVAAAEFAAEPAAAGAIEALELAPAPEETFSGSRSIGSQSLTERIRAIPTESVFGEEEPDWTKAVQLADLPPPPPPAEEEMTIASGVTGSSNRSFELPYIEKVMRDAPETAAGLMRSDIVKSIKSGYAGVPPKFLTPKGRLKSKLSNNELYSIYGDLRM